MTNRQSATSWVFKKRGRRCVIARDVVIERAERISLGDGCLLGLGVQLLANVDEIYFAKQVVLTSRCFVHGCGKLLKIGQGSTLGEGVYLSVGNASCGSITIGSQTHLGAKCVLYGHGILQIGSCVQMGENVVLATIGHDTADRGVPMSETRKKAPIIISDGVRIGENCTIAAGVTLAQDCIILANSVVTHNTQVGQTYQGVPAKLVQENAS